ncbi:N-acetylmuramic acid 6-phosphate etherase [Leifsonia sp. H3M29-4]|uniref:N-acetylmuramic acid 6-phosphate etherase n=1 Tax=Salinibacterium metalliresistens TaxID=3031321 RepID=UPI0023DC2606|nr:N-acetylmuramic acid 6-phosphate etherase [Salinibacterium metalliresistens]MDF1478282.1 N-acetylmuramic acid 6-phosphate etherase [Salinibacterium metalliresistens]
MTNNSTADSGGVAAQTAQLSTEQRNPSSVALDEMSSIEVLALLNSEDRRAVEAVAASLPDVAELVDAAVERVRRGGRVHYFGAGTSGRLAILDAAELLPTFNLPPDVVVAHIAGGADAVLRAVENAEDSRELGSQDAAGLGPDDIAIGVTASGITPYVGGALEQARSRGAATALIACNPEPALGPLADIVIVADTGPEVLSGSTRLKAGTAEKLILNGFSTAVMVALGRTWSNLMVSVVATNEKLRVRTTRILSQALSISAEQSRALLDASDGELKTALVSALVGVDSQRARELLAASSESVRDALALGAADNA